MPKEYNNDHLHVTVDRKPDCIVELAIVANSEIGQKTYKKALKNVSKEVSFPGFRKGKAPDTMVKSKYGPQIDREFKEIFLNDSVKQALDLCKLCPWNQKEQIKAEINEASVEKGGNFKVSFECFPEIPDINPSEIEVEKVEPKEIKEADVEKHILSLRYHHAEWNEVSDRPIQENDRIEVTIEIVDDENSPEKSHNHFHVAKDYLEDWLHDFFIGKKLGDSEEATPPTKEGVTSKNVRITIDKISATELEEMTDEFVKKFGAESVVEFQTRVTEHLKRQEEDNARNQLHSMIQQKLTDKYLFDVPSSLINNERQNLLTEMIESFKHSNYTDEAIQKQKDGLEELAVRNAIKNLRTHYILLKISDDQKFNVSREEMMNELIKHSIKADGTIDMDMVQNADQYSAPIIRRLQLEKAMEYLADNVTIK
ncbi:MAG: Trigger factor [Chlamydiae bacterium]|nr:Trigger factor [Chlamydiota bacterium]